MRESVLLALSDFSEGRGVATKDLSSFLANATPLPHFSNI